MLWKVMVMVMACLAVAFMSGAESAACPSGTVAVDVTSAADVQSLTDVLDCTGEAAFDITWYSSLTVSQRIEVSNKKSVTVTGAGFPTIRGGFAVNSGTGTNVVDAGSGTGIFSVSNGSTLHLNHLVLEGGNAENGGAVDVLFSSSLFVSDCNFSNNNASALGGAIYAETSAIYVAGNTSFHGNSAEYGGAMFLLFDSSVRIDQHNVFLNNSARDNGGAIYLYGSSSMRIEGSNEFIKNSAKKDGGAVYLHDNSSMELSGTNAFVSNSAGDDGGAMVLLGGSSMQIDGNTTFVDNFAVDGGGAIYLEDNSSMRMDGSHFVSNSAKNEGGAVVAFTSAVYVGNTSFRDNSARYGGAISLQESSHLRIDGSNGFVNNSVGYAGGAVDAYNKSSVQVKGTNAFLNNSAEFAGGAIYLDLSASVNIDGDNTFENNFAVDSGGAIYAYDGCSIKIEGNNSLLGNGVGNNATDPDRGAGGGVVGLLYCVIDVDGNSRFDDNFAKLTGGAMAAFASTTMNINGNASFTNNVAGTTGGALFGDRDTSLALDGKFVFDNNFAVVRGGAIGVSSSLSLHTVGTASFANNIAQENGGAVSVIGGSMYVKGDIDMYNNSAMQFGGGISVAEGSVLDIDGDSSFNNCSVNDAGGAIHSSESKVRIVGTASFNHNSAAAIGGGALYAIQSDVETGGCSYFSFNSGNDGGAILAQQSELRITGNTTFAYNSATRDGGAIETSDTSTIIATHSQEAGLPSAQNSTQGSFMETTVFTENTARDFGGAISFANPVKVDVGDVSFSSNGAESGGAVSLKSTSFTTAGFERCRFERNNATRGGGLYFNGNGERFLQDLVFRHNIAEETGGALFNEGELEIKNTVFTENTAADGGLAVQNMESAIVMLNVTFSSNRLSCPSGTYSYTQDTSSDSCRFDLACAQCLSGCESDLSNVTIDTETFPTCEEIPDGVWPTSASNTLQTLDIKEGYYRISKESPTVLICYQTEACVGGIDPSNYCAGGYEGPYCAVCSEGYAPGANNRCHSCSGDNRELAVGFYTAALVVLVIIGLLMLPYLIQIVRDGSEQTPSEGRRWWQGGLTPLRKFLVKSMPLSAIRIVVVILQIVVQFTEVAGAVYPTEYQAFLSNMGLVNFDIGSVMSRSCFFTTNFYDRLLFSTLGPLAILLACAGTFVVATIRNRGSTTAGAIVKSRHLAIIMFMVFFVYSSSSFLIFQTFVCDSMDDGKAYLRADYSITCYTDTHTSYRLYATFMIFVYPVGIPAFFAAWLARNRRELQKDDRESLAYIKPYDSLWGAYRPSSYYYEVVECGRRIVLTGVAVFILPNTAEQIAIVLFCAMIFMFVFESISPFDSRVDTWTYRWGNGIILASMYVALLLKVDLAEEESSNSSAITFLLIVAHVFMIFTVVVQSLIMMKELCESEFAEGLAARRFSRVGVRSRRVSSASEGRNG